MMLEKYSNRLLKKAKELHTYKRILNTRNGDRYRQSI